MTQKQATSGRSAYAEAGVDIDAQERALEGIKKLVQSTETSGVLSQVGGFGGLFRIPAGLQDPVLVSSADGVGTKLRVAALADDYSTVGADLVNHCVNDILVQGARPLFFMDYVGAGALDQRVMEELIGGVAGACRENGCALLGGETAEMPGFYRDGDVELVGFIVGILDRHNLIDGAGILPGDVLVALPSAGLHTNGFSLARRAILERRGLSLEDRLCEESEDTVRDVLLAPHLTYLPALQDLLGHSALRGLAHITGGGLIDNLPRILPDGLVAEIRCGSWEIPPVFRCIQEWAEVDTEEMFRVFNMGVGMVAVVEPDGLRDFLAGLRAAGTKGDPIGTVQAGERQGESSVILHFDSPPADADSK